MLKTSAQLGWNWDETYGRKDRLWAFSALGIYALLSLVWAFAADAPWDDDCPTRFLHTQNAFQDPSNFVSIWNRPLFVLLFALPAQIGKETIPLLMTLISTLGAWLLWRGVRELKVPNAWLAIPFLAFQPFFFGTSRVALTEPLAAALLCAAFFFMVHKRWHLFALMGGLLPLARLELTPLLLFWLYPMVQAKQWKPMVWMLLPFALWNVAAGIIVGDFNYVFNQSFGADTGTNRYGQTDFAHYFRRSMWVTGPVVFWFFLQGCASRWLRKGWSAWIDGQVLVGLALYVLFSWKLSMGNAAGFLRNLVPLSPLVALVALDGYNASIASLLRWREKGSTLLEKLSLVAVGGFVLFVGARFFSIQLRLHQILIALPDYSRIAVLGALAAIFVAVGWLGRNAKGAAQVRGFGLPTFVAVLTMAYALYQEPPAVSDNHERQALSIIGDFYAKSSLRSRPTYVNHNWFFWVTGENAFDAKFKRVTMQNIEAAPTGSIIIWDLHYSTRLDGDVSPQYLIDHPQFVELLRIGFANRGQAVVLLEKGPPDPAQQEVISSAFANENPRYLPAITARAFRLLWARRFPEALKLLEYPLESVKNDPDVWFGHGYALLNMGRFPEAVVSLHNAVTLSSRFPVAWYNLGRAYGGAGDLQSGVSALNHALSYDPYAQEAWYARGALKAKMRDLYGAISDFTQTLKLSPDHVEALTNRAVAYAMTEQPSLALADIAHADRVKPNDLEIRFVHGRILHQTGQKDEGCRLMREAVAAGFTKAADFLAKQCGGGVVDSLGAK